MLLDWHRNMSRLLKLKILTQLRLPLAQMTVGNALPRTVSQPHKQSLLVYLPSIQAQTNAFCTFTPMGQPQAPLVPTLPPQSQVRPACQAIPPIHCTESYTGGCLHPKWHPGSRNSNPPEPKIAAPHTKPVEAQQSC